MSTLPGGQPDNPRVLLVGNGTLLEAGIHGLLSDEADLQVVGPLNLHDPSLGWKVARAWPDAVVLTDEDPAMLAQVWDTLSDRDTICVVVVRLDGNKMDVYQKQSQVMAHGEELIAVLRRRDVAHAGVGGADAGP